jgi:hypothetical protein
MKEKADKDDREPFVILFLGQKSMYSRSHSATFTKLNQPDKMLNETVFLGLHSRTSTPAVLRTVDAGS